MHLAPGVGAACARKILASPLHAPFYMRSLGQILSPGFWRGSAKAGETRGERASCGSDTRAAQASGAGREGGRARRGLSFRLTDLLLLAALTFAGLHLLMEPMRAASGLSAEDLARSGTQNTMVCALAVILVTFIAQAFAAWRTKTRPPSRIRHVVAVAVCVALGWAVAAWSVPQLVEACFRCPERIPDVLREARAELRFVKKFPLAVVVGLTGNCSYMRTSVLEWQTLPIERIVVRKVGRRQVARRSTTGEGQLLYVYCYGNSWSKTE